MTLTVRPATESDQPTIHRTIKEAHLPRMNLRWPNFVVAEEDGSVIGVGQVKSHDDGSRELASIAVIAARRGDGIGTAIINTLLAREVAVVLHLSCRRELEGYYERFGFRRLGPASYPPYFRRTTLVINLITQFFGIHLIVMRREAAR
jgi:N-acetylglutamate synthase-like GNAT family acetyltransferase